MLPTSVLVSPGRVRLPPVLGLLALAGCAAPVLDDASSIEILFPASSTELTYCPTMPVVVEVDGFTLSPEGIDQAPVDGEGHWHLEVNGEYVGTTAEHTFLIDDSLALEPGRTHALVATLRTNQHEPLDPDVSSPEVEIFVDYTGDCLGGIGRDPAADTGT